MEPITISTRHLGKRYRLGESLGYATLRERIAESSKRVLSRVRPRPPASGAGAATAGERPRRSEFWALRDVSFNVRRGEVLGIIGRNGAGKSTLLKILSQITEPTEGEARMRGRVGSLLEVGTGMHPELTGRENVYLNGAILGMRRGEIERKYEQIVEFAGISEFMGTPIKRYSSGMRVRLGFAIAAHLDPDILIVDEVLAVGDLEFQKRCLGKMQQAADQARTVLFVSHNVATIKRLCGRAILLDGGRIVQDGDAIEVVNAYLRLSLASGRRFVFREEDHRYKSSFRIDAVELRIPEDRSAYLHGEAISLDLFLSSQEDIDGVCVGVGVTAEGTRLATVHSRPLGLKANPESRVLRCRLPGVLMPATYSLVVGAYRASDGRALDYVSQEVPLEVSHVETASSAAYDPRSMGFIHLGAEWETVGGAQSK